MKVKLTDLREPLSLSLTQNDVWLKDAFGRAQIKFKSPLSLHLTVQKDKDDLFFQGHLKTTFVLTCSRCAEDASYPIDEFFSPVFTHGDEPAKAKDDMAKAELDISYFKGDEINLGEVIKEQLLLWVPIQPLCSEKCRGMCPQCGKNLNIQECKCKNEETQSPFEVLKDFKVNRTKKQRKE